MENSQSFRKFLLLISFTFLYSLCFSQVTEQWVKRYNGPGNGEDGANSIVVDASGNVYVTGQSRGGGGIGGSIDDYATIKYDTDGNELWVRRYDGPGNSIDGARSLAVDAQGNVYVTGYSYGSGTGADYATIKYDANGNELWVRRHNGLGNGEDAGLSVAVDVFGNVYVTGSSQTSGTIQSNYDYTTIKYDMDGNELWVRRYNGTGNGDDNALDIALDASGNVYITGFSLGSNFIYSYATIKYDAAGNEMWVKRYDNGVANSLAVDTQGNVYVTGAIAGTQTGDDYGTIKYDAAGNELWVKTYNGPGNSTDGAHSIAVDVSGNVYVTGQSLNSNGYPDYDYATIKYDATGNELWIKRYNGPGIGFDVANFIAVDAQGNVYVTGSSAGSGIINFDFATIKYTQTTAAPLTVDAGADKTLYLGYGANCVTLSAEASEGTAPYKYSWSPSGGSSANFMVCPTATTIYTVTVTDANRQTASDEVKVNIIDVRCGNKGDKVQVCHKGKKTLCIARSAVNAHLRHGDQLGSCSTSPSLNSITKNTDASKLIEERPQHFRVTVAPNPLNTITRLQYELPMDGTVSIKVYDVLGREVATVVQANQKAGVYSKDLSAVNFAKGVYYYRALLNIKQQTYTQLGKMIVVK
jgi:hypothetical protein